jgi:hypothetical protein
MSLRFELRHLGRDTTVEVREHRPGRFDTIREVRVARIGTLEVCALRLEGGGDHTAAYAQSVRCGRRSRG